MGFMVRIRAALLARNATWAVLAAGALVGAPAGAADTPPAGARADSATATAGDAAAKISERVESAVVKIFATTRNPDLNRPGRGRRPARSPGRAW
jgi:hypothetical protein